MSLAEVMQQRRRHLGIDSPSNDEICALCGRHPHFNAPKMRDSGACFDDTTPARPYD